MMKKRFLALLSILSILLLFSGCQEKVEEISSSQNIVFDGGDIFELVEGRIDLTKRGGKIVEARVVMRFRNIAEKIVNANVSIEFYGKDNELIYKTYRKFLGYPPGYQDPPLSKEDLDKPIANVVRYSGEDVDKISYVAIKVSEI